MSVIASLNISDHRRPRRKPIQKTDEQKAAEKAAAKAVFLADIGAGKKPLAITGEQARWLLNIGNTKLNDLANSGHIKTIDIGERGVRFNFRSVEEFSENGVAS
jgi:hypothetical protein